MIGLKPLAERYPLPNGVKEGLENNPLSQYFNQGRELSLLVNTHEGVSVVENAELLVRKAVEETNTKFKSLTKEERQEEIDIKVEQIMNGQVSMNNLEQIKFIKNNHPDWNENSPMGETYRKEIELAQEFFHTYALANDYKRRYESDDSWRLPMEEPKEIKLRFLNTDIGTVRKSFRQGWDSVPKMVDLTPGR